MSLLTLLVAAGVSVADTEAATAAIPRDPNNPSCPRTLDWSTYREMRFTLFEFEARRILKAEGMIDADAALRLRDALKQYDPIDEIWLRSPGGDARVGNQAGMLIRKAGIPTRIPPGWACFSACNFIFMGGPIRFIDDGGNFVVHMFTHLADKDAVHAEVSQGADKAAALIGDVEQDSAMLASEDNDFLIKMGVSRKLLTEVMYKQKAVASGGDKSTRRCLTGQEAVKYNVANAQ
ncbi:hypothetical protein GCM10023264_03310 [Sphingomonas daechungensis]|uniref:hypothetical protein n=1 Tax=Sphingomonas daechungensis TaxID=1176646 RepID=UPI001CB9D4BC|nr:hypothetical protein [Sphingomonas daechungensis]